MHVSSLEIKQSILKIKSPDFATFANYYLNKNQQIVTALQHMITGLGGEIIYLYGQDNRLGRSHLAQAACDYAKTLGLSAIYLPFKNLMCHGPGILLNLENLVLICIDDIQYVTNHREWEEALLYTYQYVLLHHGRLIITANVAPKFIKCALQDLSSRLIEAVAYELQPLDDTDKMTILVQHAAARGILLPQAVVNFLFTRGDRHLSNMINGLQQLADESLRRKRKITIPFVKEILKLS